LFDNETVLLTVMFVFCRSVSQLAGVNTQTHVGMFQFCYCILCIIFYCLYCDCV